MLPRRKFTVTFAVMAFLSVAFVMIISQERAKYTQTQILQKLRVSNSEEMQGYSYPNGRFNVSARQLSDLVAEEGGVPLRSIVLSSWRSGSSFLGEILNAHPAVFYNYEPLWHKLSRRIRGPPESAVAIATLTEMLNCTYRDHSDYVDYVKKERHEILEHNWRVWRWGHYQPDLDLASYLSATCRTFPFQVTKICRLPLAQAHPLLDHPTLNVRILLSVRDPRGVMLSRSELPTPWCTHDCSNVSSLCADMVDDHTSAARLLTLYPGRVAVVRYEDLATHPITHASHILNFFGMDAHPRVLDHLNRHTQRDDKKRDPYGTFRNSSAAAFRWQKSQSYGQVQLIQQVCGEAMRVWGYVPASSQQHLRTFTPIRQLDFP